MTDYKNPFSDRKHYHEHREWVSQHLLKHFDENVISVFHEIPALDLDLDVYLIKPEKSPFNILVTSGMSTLRMNVPEQVANAEELAFAELMMLVPKNIQFEQVYTGSNKNDWIISALKRTAKFPHFYNTWVGIGHTIQAEEDFSSYGEDTQFAGAILLPSVTFDKTFTEIRKKGKKINIYTLFPLYRNELEYKIQNGYNQFLNLLVKANGKDILNPGRNNLIPQKSFWKRILGN